MDPDTVTVVSGVVSTGASVGAFVVALVALVRTRRNKAAVLDAQVESDFVARVLAKVLRLMSQDARGEDPTVDLTVSPPREVLSAEAMLNEAEADRNQRFRTAIAELQSAVVEHEQLSPMMKRMQDDGPWSAYDVLQAPHEDEPNEEDPRRQ